MIMRGKGLENKFFAPHDSRITEPYDRNDRNVIQIKGGDRDDIITGTIKLRKVRKNQQKVEFDKKSRIFRTC